MSEFMDTEENGMSIEENFIRFWIEERSLVSVFLSTGVKLQGVIISMDDKNIILECPRDGNRILIFSKYITTISEKSTEPKDRNLR